MKPIFKQFKSELANLFYTFNYNSNFNRFMNKIWKKISSVLGVIAILLGTFYFVFSNFINIPKSNLEIQVLTNTPLLELKEDIAKLNIVYDSINFIKDNKNISIIILEIKNLSYTFSICFI